MTRVDDYLRIPEDYCRYLGGLRWCPGYEAVEYEAEEPEIGCTFAMAGEIALLLEGFGAARPLIAFGHVLHLLHLLGLGLRAGPGEAGSEPPEPLLRAMLDAGRPLRNAGALCAALCREVPPAADPPSVAEVVLRLTRPLAAAAPGPRGERRAEVPPLRPLAFESRVRKALAGYPEDDLLYWLRHGTGPRPEPGEELARRLPRDWATVQDRLSQRPRLAGAAALVARLDGALALPPRRLAHAELPLGGYADLSTRGLPEQILPIQFGLDELEFLRRFAERELLYYHREEPHAPAAEQLVVVLDQGVRTWGEVRPVLAASAMALGRQASRRRIPYLVAPTSAGGLVLDAGRTDPEKLGALLEASDLSAHPGPVLQRVLEEGAGSRRDVVLLTHPRALLDAAPEAAHLAPGSRLFAVAVDAEGRSELSEVRQGLPVTLARFRVDLRGAAPRPVPALPVGDGEGAWTGDVEPIPFPFRLGALHPVEGDLFDFDDAGEWLLLAGRPDGLLHLWRGDGARGEMLPRALDAAGCTTRVYRVSGVAGGFVVFGRNESYGVAAHYDLASRHCNVHRLDSPRSLRQVYLRHLHAIVNFDYRGEPHALDLGAPKALASESSRAAEAQDEARALPRTDPVIVHPGSPARVEGRSLQLNPVTGTLAIEYSPGRSVRCTLLRDGEPAWALGRIVRAAAADGHWAAIITTPRGAALHVFADGLGAPSVTVPLRPDVKSFALSRDGARVAYPAGARQIEVRELDGSPLPRFVTPKGRFHSRLEVELGIRFLTIRAGRHIHLVLWGRGPLEFSRTEGEMSRAVVRHFEAWGRRRLEALAPSAGALAAIGGRPLDRRRFVGLCSAFGLTVLVDAYSQVAILDSRSELVAMFYVFRDQIAAWMPNGTRVGPLPLIGGPPTPEGAERIGHALRAAQGAAGGNSQ